uniref:Plasmolipin n=1 Tax=Myotis lucifugus TaxID=59463 RepID=G1Q3V2_MYOLU
MAEFPSKVSTGTSSPAQSAGASGSALRPDLDFVRSRGTSLRLLFFEVGLLVWVGGGGVSFPLRPSCGAVSYPLLQAPQDLQMFFPSFLFCSWFTLPNAPWPLMLMAFNMGATVLYITAFITCSASVEQTSLKNTRPYNQRAAASFFSCLVMIAYGLSAFFSFQAWRGVGSNAATSQMAGGYA